MDTQDANPYAPPESPILHVPDDAGVWHHKKTVVMLRSAELPDRCIYCNTQTQLTKDRRLLYMNPWLQLALLILFILFNVLAAIPIIIIILIFRKSARISIPICERHWRKRIYLTLATLGALATSIGLTIASINSHGNQQTLLISGVLIFVVSMIMALFTGQMLRASKIDLELMILKGAKPPFLDSLPEHKEE